MTVDYFNLSYFIMVFIALMVTVLSTLFLKNKSPRFQKNFILFLVFSAFSLHFLKQFFEPYRSDFPASLRNSTFENICAVSVLIYPWIFLSKSKRWKDYMFYIGLLSGVGAMLIPTEALGKELLTFDVLRFYYVHIVIFLVPFLMVKFKFHHLDYRRVYKIPLSFIIILVIILANEVILIAGGFVQTDMPTFLNQNDRNSSFIFGPTDYFKNVSWLLDIFVPAIFRTRVLGPDVGTTVYWPIIWLVIPAYVYLPILGLTLSLPYEGARLINDCKNVCSNFKKRIIRKRG